MIVAVGVLLWAPTADYFGHLDWTEPPNENRLPAAKPRLAHLDSAGVRDYLVAADAYFDDHFGFRKRLIRWCQQWKQRLFHSEGTRVIAGQNGWFYIADGRMINHYLGTEQFTPGQLESWQRLLEKRRDWLAARGIKYLFVIPPDKQTIYPENLPVWLVKATPDHRWTKLDQFVEHMRAHSTVEILDLREPLRAGKKNAPLYLQNDTHWNASGAFLGAQEVIKAVARQVPELLLLRRDDFAWSNAPVMGGDLTSLVGLKPPENNYFSFAPKALIAPQVEEITNIVRNWNPHDRSRVNMLVNNQNPTAQPVDLVIFNDSFAKPWWQFFGYSFHRCVFVWEDKEFNTRVITENHPQVVINEMLERMLNQENPDEMMARDSLP